MELTLKTLDKFLNSADSQQPAILVLSVEQLAKARKLGIISESEPFECGYSQQYKDLIKESK
jgi:hypothetical protein